MSAETPSANVRSVENNGSSERAPRATATHTTSADLARPRVPILTEAHLEKWRAAEAEHGHLSQAHLATLLGVSRGTVWLAIKVGRAPTTSSRTSNRGREGHETHAAAARVVGGPKARRNGQIQVAGVSPALEPHAKAPRLRRPHRNDLVTPQPSQRARRVTRTTPDDLMALHRAMGFYGRMLWDIQGTLNAANNRVKAMDSETLALPPDLMKPQDVISGLETASKSIDLHLTRLAREHPMRHWIEAQPGIALGGFARLLAVTGDLHRFPSVAKLWKYLGLAVQDGHRQRMVKGQLASHTNCNFGHLRTCKPGCMRDHHPNCVPGGVGNAYAPQGLVVCRQLGESIEKLKPGNGPYRQAYDLRKAVTSLQREWTPMHIRADARRIAIKKLIKEMWVAWRACVPA